MHTDPFPTGNVLPEVEGVEYAETSISFNADNLTETEWKRLIRELSLSHSRLNWYIGDAIVFADDRSWGDTYTWAIAATGRAESTLQKYAWVARQIPADARVEGLAWSAHKLLCERVKDRTERAFWLREARRLGWRGDELRVKLRPSPEPDHSGSSSSESFENQYRCPNPACRHQWSGHPTDAPYVEAPIPAADLAVSA